MTEMGMTGNALTPTRWQTEAQQLGLFSDTPDPSANSSYVIDGQTYYVNGVQQQEVGGAGINGAQQTLLASLADPYLNDASKQAALDAYKSGQYDSYNTTRQPGEDYGAYHARVNAGQGAPGTGAPGAPGATPGAIPLGGTPEQRDAAALIRQALATYGLPSSLGDWAWQEIVAGKSQNEVMLDLYQRPEFKDEFGAVMDGRQKAGLAPMSPGDIVSWRNTAQQMMRAAGLPAGLHDSKAELDQNMVDNVSAQEFHDRVVGAADAMFRWDPNDIRALQDHGLSTGDLIGMWLNPDKAQPLIEQTVAAARIGGAAYRSGFGQVANDQADLYATQGVTQQQAQTGFTQLAHDQQLFNPLAGAGGSEDTITQADQLAAAFGGNNAQQRRIEQRRQQRQATFQDGGGFASSPTGMSGLGSSQQ